MFARHSLAALSVGLFMLALTAACGDGLEQRPSASLSCVEGDEISGCDGVFGAPGRPGGPQGLNLNFKNFGEYPARITLVELVNAPPEIAIPDTVLVNTNRYSEDAWELDDAGHRLSPTGSDIQLPYNRVLGIRVIYTPNRNNTLECPESHDGSCGTLRLHTKNSGVRGNVVEIPLRLHRASGQIVIGPPEVTFPSDVVAGRTYVADDQVVITNTGAANINIVDFYFEPRIPGLEAEAVGFPNLDAIPLSPGNSVAFSLKWTPAENNASVNASFVVETSATDGTRRVRVTSGGANQPEIAVLDAAQEALDEIVFGPLGDDGSSEVSFNIENRGASNLSWGAHFASVQPSSASRALALRDSFGPLEVNPDPIQPGNGIGLSAIYTPDPANADTAVTATLRITSNDGSRPTISIPVSAGPAQALLNLIPSSIFWGIIDEGSSETRTLELRNVGRADATISSIELSGTQKDYYTVDTTSPLTIPAGQVRTLDVTYTRPQEALGAMHSAALTFTYNNPVQPELIVRLEASQNELHLPPSCVISAQPAEPYSVDQTITFSAAQSSSNSGGQLNFDDARWSLTGPGDRAESLSDAAGASTSFAPRTPGSYTIRLTLSEGISECQTSRTFVVADR